MVNRNSSAGREGVDIAANRASRSWSRKALAARALWELLCTPLFACSPRPLWGWRRAVLRLFGARVGRAVRLHPSVRIAVPWNVDIGEYAAIGDSAILYSLGRIRIGSSATVSQNAHLCAGTHDHRRPDLPLIKAPIDIGSGAWVCADAFVGPGVTVGEMAVVGARAVVIRDVPSRAIVAGNPARIVGERRMV
jgi:putative colanic acid biosynthesis acetyltransferase WcaF